MSGEKFAFSLAHANMSKEELKSLLKATAESAQVRPKSAKAKPNFYTNPTKRGTYGYGGVLFGERPGSKYHPYRGQNAAEHADEPLQSNTRTKSSHPPFYSRVNCSSLQRDKVLPLREIGQQPRGEGTKKTSREELRPFYAGSSASQPIYKDYPVYLPHSHGSDNGLSLAMRISREHGKKKAWLPPNASSSYPCQTIFLRKRNIGWRH